MDQGAARLLSRFAKPALHGDLRSTRLKQLSAFVWGVVIRPCLQEFPIIERLGFHAAKKETSDRFSIEVRSRSVRMAQRHRVIARRSARQS